MHCAYKIKPYKELPVDLELLPVDLDILAVDPKT